KDYIIPVTMHKVKNKLEVNCTNITPDCDDFSTLNNISQDLQELSGYDDSTFAKYNGLKDELYEMSSEEFWQEPLVEIS
ncbi:8750_t:CDS:2, partial [Racocetra persica]